MEIRAFYPGITGRIDLTDNRMRVDGDDIAIEVEDIGQKKGHNVIEICLKLAPDVTWWKSIQVVVRGHDEKGNEDYTQYGQAELQDDKKGPVLALDYRVAPSAQPPDAFELRFWKAKVFGIHTDMEHWLMEGPKMLNKRITFTWLIE